MIFKSTKAKIQVEQVKKKVKQVAREPNFQKSKFSERKPIHSEKSLTGRKGWRPIKTIKTEKPVEGTIGRPGRQVRKRKTS